jgi:Ca2+-binding EF-hand superfamily protein
MKLIPVLCTVLASPFFLQAAPPTKSDKPEKVDAGAFLKKFDTDGDVKLDKTELSAGLRSLKHNVVTTRNDSWKAFDADADGRISLTELGKLLDENSKEKVEAVPFMEKFDRNRDGKLDTFEMSTGFKSLRPTPLTAKSDFWKKFDANYDGKINAKELEKLLDEYNK